jgi:RNA polymerase sigma-70 factor (ECF subfamily)
MASVFGYPAARIELTLGSHAAGADCTSGKQAHGRAQRKAPAPLPALSPQNCGQVPAQSFPVSRANESVRSVRNARSMNNAVDREALQAMLRRASAGDQQAWRQIIDTYSPRVFGLIRAQCNNFELAEEITQSTFCTIVAKIGSYAELGKFEPWLFRIAMNRLRDEMRRRKRQARSVEQEALTALAGAAEEGDPLRAEPLELESLRSAIAQLSEADQRIIHLRHYAELSFRQIADILEQPLGTVLARQHRALKKLAELMEQHVYPPEHRAKPEKTGPQRAQGTPEKGGPQSGSGKPGESD